MTSQWTVYILGPDELHPCPDEAHARDWARAVNRRFGMVKDHPYSARIWANVIPPKDHE